MRRRITVAVAMMLVAQLTLIGSSGLLISSARAQGGMPGNMGGGGGVGTQGQPMQMGSTTRAQREAAAARAAAARQAAASGSSPIDSTINWFLCLLQGTQPGAAATSMGMSGAAPGWVPW
ncbi:MAG: hypothetical protein WCI67_08395, partial [Chloroflexales bacterium]